MSHAPYALRAAAGALLFACAASALALGSTSSQDGGPKPPDQTRQLDDQKEIVRLFHAVEKRLAEIDDLLYGAGAGEKPLEKTAESGIDSLLRASNERGQEVLRSIDKIVEIAQRNAQPSSSQSGGGSPSSEQGGSPLDRKQGPAQEKEKTPVAPKDKPEGSEPEPKDGQSQPNNPRESAGDPRNRPGPPPAGQETKHGTAPNDNDRWGDLPVRVRDLFRTEGGGDLPPQYRDWIDAYYRRLNRKP